MTDVGPQPGAPGPQSPGQPLADPPPGPQSPGAAGPQSPPVGAPPAGAPVATQTQPVGAQPVPGYQQQTGPSGPRAGFWTRFGAALIDGIILAVIQAILGAIVGSSAGQGLGILIALGYFTYFEGGPSGQTVGKRVLKIRVIDFQTGGEIGYVRGFIRWIGRYLSAIVILLGYLWMLWDKEKQTWHDKLSGAVVVPQDAYPVAKWPA